MRSLTADLIASDREGKSSICTRKSRAFRCLLGTRMVTFSVSGSVIFHPALPCFPQMSSVPLLPYQSRTAPYIDMKYIKPRVFFPCALEKDSAGVYHHSKNTLYEFHNRVSKGCFLANRIPT